MQVFCAVLRSQQVQPICVMLSTSYTRHGSSKKQHQPSTRRLARDNGGINTIHARYFTPGGESLLPLIDQNTTVTAVIESEMNYRALASCHPSAFRATTKSTPTSNILSHHLRDSRRAGRRGAMDIYQVQGTRCAVLTPEHPEKQPQKTLWCFGFQETCKKASHV